MHFRDARDLHGPHAGQRLSSDSLALLDRLARCADRLKLLDLPVEAILAPQDVK
jgi:hypothetical protein